MRRLLWVGDAVVSTGFARCTHKTLDVLKDDYEVHVLGINYLGDPHPYPYAIYPAWIGGDPFGVRRIKKMVEAIKPDVIVLQNDPWNIPTCVKEIEGDIPIVATLAVDGKNCKGLGLNNLACAIFWTKFGLDEANAGGFVKRGEVIPLGVDLDVYAPSDKIAARRALGLPDFLDKAFIVGNVNRNQPRKRLDLTIKYFAEWVKEANIDDAYLLLHIAPTGDSGYDARQLARYYGLKRRLLLVEPEIGFGVEEKALARSYSAFDVQVTTTQGEGWGLTTMEGMACGVPQIVPVWSALGEWTENAAVRIHCDSTICTPDLINVVGGVPMQRTFQTALDNFYRDPGLRRKYALRGLDLVAQEKYRWKNIGERFRDVIGSVLDDHNAATAPAPETVGSNA